MAQSVTRQVGTSTRPGWVFVLVAAGVLMSNLDAFVVNVALPEIARQFHHASLGSVSWVLNAYAVVFAALLVPAGNMADRYGPRDCYLAGTAAFTASSLACALAPSLWWLIGFRLAQAVGAAVLVPASLGLLLAAAPPEKRMLYVRGWTAISGAGAALGPAVGGLLTAASWRWVFLMNLPVGVVVMIAGTALLPRPPSRATHARVDVVGVVLLAGGIGLLALGLVESPAWGWSSGLTLAVLVAAPLLLLCFAAWSVRYPSPVLPPPLLRVSGFAPASLANLLFAVPFAAMLLSIVLWAQQVWHWSALATGFAVAPGPVMVPPFAVLIGPALVRRASTRTVSAGGCLVFAAGIVWWLATLDAHADYLHMLPGMLLTGVGVGLTVPTLIGTAVAALPPTSFTTGAGVVTMVRQLGSVLGVALLVAFLGNGGGPRITTDAFDRGWWFTVAATAVAALACLWQRGYRRASSGLNDRGRG